MTPAEERKLRSERPDWAPYDVVEYMDRLWYEIELLQMKLNFVQMPPHGIADVYIQKIEQVYILSRRIVRLRQALDQIRDPRQRHQEPDQYTELGCVMNIADLAIEADNEEIEKWKKS